MGLRNNMIWRRVKPTETELLLEANTFERDFPSFYRDSSNTWSTDEQSALKFYTEICKTIFGIFTDDLKLVGLVYLENITDDVCNVHFDIRRGADIEEIIYALAGIRDYQFHFGMRICQAWILKRNRGIQKVLKSIGFKETFLSMKSGFSHGKVLEWTQLCIAPNSFNRDEVVA